MNLMPLLARRMPIGLAHGVALTRDVAAGEVVSWSAVAIEDSEPVRLRREMERGRAPVI